MKALYFISIILLTLLSTNLSGQSGLGSNTKISLITCAPGEDVYSVFGHTALRLQDSASGRDLIINYGLFDFSTENFIYKFVKGETYYKLGIHNYESFIYEYQKENRSVWQQNLRLDSAQTITLLEQILYDYRPENRVYLYNFLYDNCATRVRDRVEFAGKTGSYAGPTKDETIRELINSYLTLHKWTALGINLALGKPLDEIISPRQRLFLPYELQSAFEGVLKADGNSLVESQIVLFQSDENITNSQFSISPLWVSLLLLVLVVLRFLYKKSKPSRLFVGLLLLFSGIAGVILLFICFFSIHPAVFPNVNLFYFSPLNLILGTFILSSRNKKHNILCLKYLLFYLLAVIPVIALSGQHIAVEIWLFMMVLLGMIFTEYWILKKSFLQR
jgi:hypothetical protein